MEPRGFARSREVDARAEMQIRGRGAVGRLRTREHDIHHPLNLRDAEQVPRSPSIADGAACEHAGRRGTLFARGRCNLHLGLMAVGHDEPNPQARVQRQGAEGLKGGDLAQL